MKRFKSRNERNFNVFYFLTKLGRKKKENNKSKTKKEEPMQWKKKARKDNKKDWTQ